MGNYINIIIDFIVLYLTMTDYNIYKEYHDTLSLFVKKQIALNQHCLAQDKKLLLVAIKR